jgi:hypothetical protein
VPLCWTATLLLTAAPVLERNTKITPLHLVLPTFFIFFSSD